MKGVCVLGLQDVGRRRGPLRPGLAARSPAALPAAPDVLPAAPVGPPGGLPRRLPLQRWVGTLHAADSKRFVPTNVSEDGFSRLMRCPQTMCCAAHARE